MLQHVHHTHSFKSFLAQYILQIYTLVYEELPWWLTDKERKEVKSLSCVRLFVTPWTVAYQAPPSMEFSSQEYRSVLPFPSAGDLPYPGIELRSPALQADSLPTELSGKHKLDICGHDLP